MTRFSGHLLDFIDWATALSSRGSQSKLGVCKNPFIEQEYESCRQLRQFVVSRFERKCWKVQTLFGKAQCPAIRVAQVNDIIVLVAEGEGCEPQVRLSIVTDGHLVSPKSLSF